MFRQSSELCLIWLHDIPHILHQAQGQLFALTLTFLSSNALALTPPWLTCLVPGTNSLTKFTSSRPVHASCCIYLCVSASFCCPLLFHPVLSCQSYVLVIPTSLPCTLPSSFPLPPSPSFSLSVSPSFPPRLPVEVRYDAEPESSPVFNYINKTPCEVEWPRTPQPSLYPLHSSPSFHLFLPVVLQT